MRIFETTMEDGTKFTAVCDSMSMRNGFKHVGTLFKNNREITSAVCYYQNRTWERYTFESVLKELKQKMDRELKPSQLQHIQDMIDRK